MAINRNDLELAKWLVEQAAYTGQPLNPDDCFLIKKFIDALLEHQDRPTENVKSREWRAAIYRKLLDDPEALEQFTYQALEKFGPEQLSMMVAPELQSLIVDRHLSTMSAHELFQLLNEHDQIGDLVDYLITNEPDYVSEQLGYSQEDLAEQSEDAYDSGYQDGHEAGLEKGFDEGFARGLEEK